MKMRYILFTSPGCRACPSVKRYLTELEKRGVAYGESLDISEEKNYEKAVSFDVKKSPTVIVFNTEGKEIARAHSVEDIKSVVFGW